MQPTFAPHPFEQSLGTISGTRPEVHHLWCPEMKIVGPVAFNSEIQQAYSVFKAYQVWVLP